MYMTQSVFDEMFMRRAIEIAWRGRWTTHPNPRVGCVIVKGDKIIGEGWHLRAGEGHAEVNALKSLKESPNGATAYVTLEPCSHYGRTPPCAKALIEAGVARVVAAMTDPNPQVSGRGLKMLADAGIAVQSGLLEADAEALNVSFLFRMRNGRPFVRLKMAESIDGRTALANGESKWITGEEARADVQRWRAECGAILTSCATVAADNPSMNVRPSQLPKDVLDAYPDSALRQPDLIVMGSNISASADANIFSEPTRRVIAVYPEGGQSCGSFSETLKVGGIGYGQPGYLKRALELIAEQNINDVWVEAGSRLSAVFMRENLVDEFILYVAPKLLGSDAKPLLNIAGPACMDDAKIFAPESVERFGNDVRIVMKPKA